jgi:hypothetical protein
MAQIMVTNGGAHPPDKWAMITAQRIFEIAPTLTGQRLVQAQNFQMIITKILIPHYNKIQINKRRSLADDAKNILLPYDVVDHLDRIMTEIVMAAKTTLWANHFADASVQRAAREIIGGDIATEQHVERLCYADQHQNCMESQRYSDVFRGTMKLPA